MEYNVRITEVRKIIVPVEADSMAEAKMIAERNWKNNEYVGSDVRSRDVSFETLYPDFIPSDTLHSAITGRNRTRIAAAAAEGPTAKRKTRRSRPEM